MKKIFILFFIAVIFASCKTNQLFISVMSPSPVTLSNGVKRVGIVNHSIPADEDKAVNVLHEVLSAESISMIKEGSAEGMRGLKDALMENKRFEFVTILDTVKLRSAVVGAFPAPLSWERVEDICKRNNLDAIFVLEMFHTELKVNAPIPTNIQNPMAVVNAVRNINYNTLVKTGWRIYDPVARAVVDEYTIMKDMNYNSNGNIAEKVDGLIQRKEYVKQTANLAGHIYSERIIPRWYRVERDYFIRGGNVNFRIAMRRARVGNWDEAADLWNKETNSPRRKTAGRACYNMGIINEINGNLDESIKWVQKSYEDYRIRLALRYLYILRDRKRQSDLLNIQNTQ